MTLEDLVVRLGTDRATLRHWVSLGLVDEVDGQYDDRALERGRLLAFLDRRGVRADLVAEVTKRDGEILDRFVELVGRRRGPGCTLEEAAERAGIDLALARRFWVAAGAGDRNELFEDDVESLAAGARALAAGLPPEALLQLVRVLADSLGRVADAEGRLFHFYVHEQLRASGLTGPDLMDATSRASEPLLGLIEPAILYFHRKAWERSIREDLVLHLHESLPGATVGELPLAVLFVDLAGFTPLTEAMGDLAAADVLDRFSDLVRDVASRCSGRVVKQIGDEFMLVLPSGREAVSAGVSILRRAASEPDFPAVRIGAHDGRALYREADYLGAAVNVAARVTSEAARGQFLVTRAVERSAADVPDVEWIPVGRRALKGVAEPVEVFEVRSVGGVAPRPVDPVCGMEIDDQGCEQRLEWQGRTVLFCSDRCLQRFRADPQRFPLGA